MCQSCNKLLPDCDTRDIAWWLDVETGERQAIFEEGTIDQPLWSPDGQAILLPISSQNFPGGWLRVTADGGSSALVGFDPSVPEEIQGAGLGSS